MKRFYGLICSILFIFILCGCNEATTDSDVGLDIKAGVSDFAFEDTYQYNESIIEKWNTEEAQEYLSQMENSNPGNVMFILGNLAFYNNKIEEAKELFANALELLDPDEDFEAYSKILYEQAKWDIYDEKYEDALAKIDKIQELYEGKKDHTIQIRINIMWAYDVLNLDDGIERSIDIANQARQLADEYGYFEMEYVIYQQACSYSYADELMTANNYYSEALKIARENKSKYWINTICTEIGVNYMAVGNYDKSIEYLMEALENADDLSVQQYQIDEKKVYLYDELATAYLEMGELDKAKEYYDIEAEAIEILPDGKNKDDNTMNYNCSLSRYCVRLGKFEEAEEYIKKAEENYNAYDYWFFYNFDCYIYECYGNLYYTKGDYDKALEYYKKAEKIYRDQNSDIAELECVNRIYSIYCVQKEFDLAISYADERYQALNSRYAAQEQQNEDYMLEKLKANEKETEINELRFRNKTLNIIIISGGVLVLIAIVFAIVMLNQVKKVRILNAKLKEISLRDSLSGLNNRGALTEYLESNWNMFCNEKCPISVIMIDIDYFKKYNDSYGHQAGDKIITTVSDILKDEFSEDFVARYGGEEFLIVLPATGTGQAMDKVRSVKEKLSSLRIEHKDSLVSSYITISAGIATTDTSIGYLEMIRYADQALYNAKRYRDSIETIRV